MNVTKKQSGSFNAFELLCISANIEPGDTLLAQDIDGNEFKYLWCGKVDRYSIYVIGEDGKEQRFFTSGLDDKQGRMIVDRCDKNPLSLKLLGL